jgi:hypothetical protein
MGRSAERPPAFLHKRRIPYNENQILTARRGGPFAFLLGRFKSSLPDQSSQANTNSRKPLQKSPVDDFVARHPPSGILND